MGPEGEEGRRGLEGFEDRERREEMWMERYGHGKAGKHKPGPWSWETPPKLEEKASVLGRYLLLMQRGLRAERGAKGAQDTAMAPSRSAGGDGRSDALVVRKAHAWRNKGPSSAPTKPLSSRRPRRRGGVCFSSHLTFGFDFKPVVTCCSSELWV